MVKQAHDIDLYSRGTGILSFDRWTPEGLPTGLRDLGNATNFTLGMAVERKEHTSMRGVSPTVDLEITGKRKLNGKFTLDEYDLENLRMFLFGITGMFAIAPLTSGDIEGQLDFIGLNDQGMKYHVQLWDVRLFPSGDLSFIGEDWGPIPFEFTVFSDTVGHPSSPYGLITPIAES